jgi:hypothetical protein
LTKLFDSPRGAVFSDDRLYRYALWRNWGDEGGRVMFVGLNPSTADETVDDPTIRRCTGYASDWGFSGLLIGNLFAYRATRPQTLRNAAQPVGNSNEKWLRNMASAANKILVCWGNHGCLLAQDEWFVSHFDRLYCLAINMTGAPAHPLYLRKSLQPHPF